MKIFLIRHGIAEERNNNLPDEMRILTDKGIIKTQQVAQKLKNLKLDFTVILTSPLVRAKETALILQQANLGENIEEINYLAPQGSLEDCLKWLFNSEYYQDNSNIALVGHQPDLSTWAELLLWGKVETSKLIFKKAGIIGLEMPMTQQPLGKCQLFLLTSPKWMI